MTAAREGARVIMADDRTGALEAAAQCADAGLATTVVAVGSAEIIESVTGDDAEVVVVDLASRHLAPADAAARVRRVADAVGDRLVMHKIDSTLRGNWATEAGALAASGRRLLLVPAFPAAGRTCIGGIVLEHGVPVDRTAHGRDPRSAATTSRPASVIAAAVELADADAVRRWRAPGGIVGVADASTDDDVRAVVSAAVDGAGALGSEIVLVGPAAVAGQWARRQAAVGGVEVSHVDRHQSVIVAPVVVVCGSAHTISRAQVARLTSRGVASVVPGAEASLPADAAVVVIVAPGIETGSADHADMAATLGRAGRAAVARAGAATVVVLGGDTAEALVGERPVRVHGSLGVGIACGTVDLDGRSVVIVAKPGGFGDPGTLEALMDFLLTPAPRLDATAAEATSGRGT
ncbi:MAG: four-carbon acid sugar kinase family protein [Ilumatobacteraceae bacterium]